MKPDRNRAKLGGAVAPMQQSPLVFPQQDWEAADLTHTDARRTEQQAVKEAVNDPNISNQLAARKQVPSPASSAPQFQPSRGTEVGNMVTGVKREGSDNRPEVVAGTLMSGGSAAPPRPPHVPLKDWPVVRVVTNAPNSGEEL